MVAHQRSCSNAKDSDSVGLGRDLRVSLFNKLSGDANGSNPQTTNSGMYIKYLVLPVTFFICDLLADLTLHPVQFQTDCVFSGLPPCFLLELSFVLLTVASHHMLSLCPCVPCMNLVWSCFWVFPEYNVLICQCNYYLFNSLFCFHLRLPT